MVDQAQPEVRRTEFRPLSDEALELYREGEKNLRAGCFVAARDQLARAVELAPDHARIRSIWGLSLAYVDRDFEQARVLCESAAQQEFFNPDLYLNLARVYLAFGRRAEGLRYLRRGEMIDPGHPLIQRELAVLGRRRAPILPFLPRRHPINRALGGARNLIRANLRGRTTA
jgi:Flp pilus assembly protein TadD